MSRIRNVRVAQSDPRQEALWRAAFMSQGFNVASVPLAQSLADLVSAAKRRPGDAELLIIDLADLAAEGLRLPEFNRRLRHAAPGTQLVVTLAKRLEIAPPERRWALAHGALEILPALSAAEDAPETLDRLTRLAAAVGAPPVDGERLRRSVRVLVGGLAGGPGGDAVLELARRGIDLGEAVRRMRGRGGVPCEDRRYRLKRYPKCFVGSEAADWMVSEYGLSRELAVAAGQAMVERGVIYHVHKDHPFEDAPLFYRFAEPAAALDDVDIDDLVALMAGPGGVPIEDRRYLGTSYPQCFVGAEAVDWLCARYGVSREDGVTVGQRLVDLYLLRHVVDEHDFIDGPFFYRFNGAARGTARGAA